MERKPPAPGDLNRGENARAEPHRQGKEEQRQEDQVDRPQGIVHLALAHRLLGTTLPGEVIGRIRRDRVAAHLTNQYAKRVFAPVRPWMRHVWRDWVYVNSRERLSDRPAKAKQRLAVTRSDLSHGQGVDELAEPAG